MPAVQRCRTSGTKATSWLPVGNRPFTATCYDRSMGYPFSSSSPDEGRDQVLTNFEDPRDCQMTGRKIGGGGTGRPSIRVTTGKRRVVISMLTRNHLVFARRKKQSIEMLAAGATTDEVSAWVKNDEEAECCCLIRQRMGRRGQPTVGDVIRLIDSLSVLPGRKEISAKRKKDQRSALRRLARYAIEFRLKLNLPPEVIRYCELPTGS